MRFELYTSSFQGERAINCAIEACFHLITRNGRNEMEFETFWNLSGEFSTAISDLKLY